MASGVEENRRFSKIEIQFLNSITGCRIGGRANVIIYKDWVDTHLQFYEEFFWKFNFVTEYGQIKCSPPPVNFFSFFLFDAASLCRDRDGCMSLR